VAHAQQVSGFIATVLARYGRIDALVNNAAIHPRGDILATSEEMFDRVIDVNLKGMFLITKAVLPHMIANKRGAIVNVGSGLSRSRKSAQDDKWSFCLTRGTLCPANQERQ
jgi:NAD(P)-dependent dehydrogenase (short-subunit alcohol dehydrogenase family)